MRPLRSARDPQQPRQPQPQARPAPMIRQPQPSYGSLADSAFTALIPKVPVAPTPEARSPWIGASPAMRLAITSAADRVIREQPERPGAMERVLRHFEIRERGSDLATEIRAGIVNFLTMSYVLLVNPQILSQAGIPPMDVVIGTTLASCVATLICGIFGNLPFGLAPGMGLSAYLAYGMVHQADQSWHTALTVCLLAGIFTLICTLLHISQRIMNWMPEAVKLGTVVGMGLLLSLIGFQSVGLVVADPRSLVRLGELDNWNMWLALAGMLFILTLTQLRVRGAMLLGIISLTLVAWVITDDWPRRLVMLPIPEKATALLDFKGLSYRSLPGFAAFVFVGIFDVAAVMYGVARMVFPDDHKTLRRSGVPGGFWVFLAASVGSIIAALLGCSPIIVHIESAAGVKVGGRTGLTAVVTGVLFGMSLFLAPLFGAVPTVATAPILILVGCLMLGECITHIRFHNLLEGVPAFLTMILMPFTFSIPTGLFFGLSSYLALWLCTGQWLEDLKPQPLPSDAEEYEGEALGLTDEDHMVEEGVGSMEEAALEEQSGPAADLGFPPLGEPHPLSWHAPPRIFHPPTPQLLPHEVDLEAARAADDDSKYPSDDSNLLQQQQQLREESRQSVLRMHQQLLHEERCLDSDMDSLGDFQPQPPPPMMLSRSRSAAAQTAPRYARPPSQHDEYADDEREEETETEADLRRGQSAATVATTAGEEEHENEADEGDEEDRWQRASTMMRASSDLGSSGVLDF